MKRVYVEIDYIKIKWIYAKKMTNMVFLILYMCVLTTKERDRENIEPLQANEYIDVEKEMRV